jgi:hypothetical protein
LDAAIALGYVGKKFRAQCLFKNIERKKPVHEWEYKLQERARGFGETLDRPDDFRRYVEEATWRTRKLLKLPERHELGSIDQKQHDAVSRLLKARFDTLRVMFR